MIVLNEIIELVLGLLLGLDLPEKEGAKGIALKQAIEELADLICPQTNSAGWPGVCTGVLLRL